MNDEKRRTIRIKWVRSGVGFSYRQKGMIRSLGLRRLNEVVERPDTPSIRGLVARIPHLVEIVAEPPKPSWSAVPEYTVYHPEPAPAQQTAPAAESVAGVLAPEAEAVGKPEEETAGLPKATQPRQPPEGPATTKSRAFKAGETKSPKSAISEGEKSGKARKK